MFGDTGRMTERRGLLKTMRRAMRRMMRPDEGSPRDLPMDRLRDDGVGNLVERKQRAGGEKDRPNQKRFHLHTPYLPRLCYNPMARSFNFVNVKFLAAGNVRAGAGVYGV